MVTFNLQLFGGRGSSSKGGSKGGAVIGTSYGQTVYVQPSKPTTRKRGK